MIRWSVSLFALLLPAAAFWLHAPTAPAPATVPADSLDAERARYVEEVMRQIAGREEEPAGEVFRHVELFADVPAGRFVRIMNGGFSRSLGVSCTHCHVAGNWAAEDSVTKHVAREMVRMTRGIQERLTAIEGLRGDQPTVNCGTCHRGQPRPGQGR